VSYTKSPVACLRIFTARGNCGERQARMSHRMKVYESRVTVKQLLTSNVIFIVWVLLSDHTEA
jgi:hypothetical protein